MEDTSELKEKLRRLKNIMTVAKGNTRMMENEIVRIERELTRRKQLYGV